jgi:hypothetical protein
MTREHVINLWIMGSGERHIINLSNLKLPSPYIRWFDQGLDAMRYCPCAHNPLGP